MRAFLVTVSTLALVLAVSAVPANTGEDLPHIDNFDESGECIPNQRFYHKCNACHCGANGKTASCTFKGCPSYDTIRIDNYVQGQKCPAGKSFYDKCNPCKCGDNGVSAVCSFMACPKYENKPVPRTRRAVEKIDYHIDNFSENGKCVPNLFFYDQCNPCTCGPDGKSAACTLMACPEYGPMRIDNYVQGMKCPSGKKFYVQCNSCGCGPDGLSAFCTRMACPEYEPFEKHVSRTRRAVENINAEEPTSPASKPMQENIPHIDNYDEVRECVPNKSFYSKCNECQCGNDGKMAFCTLMTCPNYNTVRIDNYVQGQKCPAGKSFYDKCNSCKCDDNGVSATCTMMACPEYEVEEPTLSPKPVQKNVPHIDNFDETGECVPNKGFYNKCNACRCSEDGKQAACTKMACPHYDEMRIDNYVYGMKCPAGKHFKNRCNDCNCGSDGLSATCTFMACPVEE